MRSSTPIKKTPQKSRQLSTQRSSASNKSKMNSLYFCNYRNAMYMGGIKSFQKHGPGILLHDNGTCVLSNYYNDIIHGHNIYFNNRCLASAQYIKNRLSEIVYRTDGFLLSLNYNLDSMLDGSCILLNYTLKSIIYATFKKGNLVQKKQEKDYTVINKVFQIGNLQFLIGKKHARVISYDMDKMIPNISVQKAGNKINIGYSKHGLLNGLGFSMLIRGSHGGLNLDTHRNQDQFELKLIQRGYYNNSQLNGLGQKWFKNGNLYVGQFRNNIFQGSGILKNGAKQNWVSGYFQNGNLIDLVQYNNEGDYKRCQKIIQSLHQRKTNWINNQITLLSFETFDKQIQKILSMASKNYTKTLQERKQQILKKIQRNFVCEDIAYGGVSIFQDDTNELTQTAKKLGSYRNDKQQNASPPLQNSNFNEYADSNNKKFIRNFIPQSFSNSSQIQSPINPNMTNYKDRNVRQPGQNQNLLYAHTNEFKQDSQNKFLLQSSGYKNLSSSGRIDSARKSRIFNKDFIQYNRSNVSKTPGSKSQIGLFKLHKIQERRKSMTPTTEKHSYNLSSSRRKRNLPIFQGSTKYNPRDSRKTSSNIHSSYNPAKNLIKEYQNSPSSSQVKLDLSKKQYLNQNRTKQSLDSKRIVGKSQIFNYLKDQSLQQPPKFNYKLADTQNLRLQYQKTNEQGQQKSGGQSPSRIQNSNNRNSNNNFTFTN